MTSNIAFSLLLPTSSDIACSFQSRTHKRSSGASPGVQQCRKLQHKSANTICHLVRHNTARPRQFHATKQSKAFTCDTGDHFATSRNRRRSCSSTNCGQRILALQRSVRRLTLWQRQAVVRELGCWSQQPSATFSDLQRPSGQSCHGFELKV